HGASAWEEWDRVFTRIKIAGISKEVPPVRPLVSAFADVTGIRRTPRQPALDQHRRINDPSLEHLPISFFPRKGIVQREREVMPLVEIRIAIVRIGIQIVLRSMDATSCGV